MRLAKYMEVNGVQVQDKNVVEADARKIRGLGKFGGNFIRCNQVVSMKNIRMHSVYGHVPDQMTFPRS